jgi:hypothetical protein
MDLLRVEEFVPDGEPGPLLQRGELDIENPDLMHDRGATIESVIAAGYRRAGPEPVLLRKAQVRLASPLDGLMRRTYSVLGGWKGLPRLDRATVNACQDRQFILDLLARLAREDPGLRQGWLEYLELEDIGPSARQPVIRSKADGEVWVRSRSQSRVVLVAAGVVLVLIIALVVASVTGLLGGRGAAGPGRETARPDVRMHLRPDWQSPVHRTLPVGTAVAVAESTGSGRDRWYRVTLPSRQTGWIHGEALTAPGEFRTVSTDSAEVIGLLSGRPLRTLRAGDSIEVIGDDGANLRVNIREGRHGIVPASAFRRRGTPQYTPPAPATPPAPGR